MNPPPERSASWPAAIESAHALYCQLTGQSLSLRFDRQRLWYQFLREGFTQADLRRTVAYLQREIAAGRRNVGALKLSNLLQLDRFEEDLNIGRALLRPPPPPAPPRAQPPNPADPLARTEHLEELRRLRGLLAGLPPQPAGRDPAASTQHRDTGTDFPTK